jgi:hypothetical protein
MQTRRQRLDEYGPTAELWDQKLPSASDSISWLSHFKEITHYGDVGVLMRLNPGVLPVDSFAKKTVASLYDLSLRRRVAKHMTQTPV